MKAAILTNLRKMEIRDIPAPRIERDDDVLLKVEAVGVCGSDVHYYETGRIGSQVIEYPFRVGHECSAIVENFGSAVTDLEIGQRIVVDPAIPCHNCDQCRAGRENTCRNLKFLGCPGQIDGCLCEYIVMPRKSCFPVEPGFTPARAALCEPLTIGVYAVERADLPADAQIAVLGAGPIGLSCLLAAKARHNAVCYMTEKIDRRIETARRGGADWTGNPLKQDVVSEILKAQPAGLDAVFECAGQQETIDQAVEILKPGGKLMLIGIPRVERISFIIDRIRRKELSVINIRRQNKCTAKCIDLVKAGKIDPDFMITHRFSLEQTTEAFEMIAEYADGVVKALIEM